MLREERKINKKMGIENYPDEVKKFISILYFIFSEFKLKLSCCN